MWDRVKIALEVHIYQPFDGRPLLLNLVKCGVWRSSWSESMRTVLKNRLIDAFQYASDNFLHQLVVPRRETERPLFPICLQNVGSSYWFEVVGSVFESLDDGLDSLFREPIQGGVIYSLGDCSIIGVDVGIRLVPQNGVLHQTEKSIDSFSLL